MRSQILLGLALLTWSGSLSPMAVAQERQTPNTLKLDRNIQPPMARIADLAWLQGHWIGEGLGGVTEEVWAPPLGDSMMGMYRLVKNGKVVFSELLFIVETDNSLVLKLKHFDAAFKGWEDKDVSQNFPLVKLAPNQAFFDGITFRKRDDGTLQAFVAIHRRGGGVREEEFRYKPAKR